MTLPQNQSIETIRLIGGRPCLDFVNTAVFNEPGTEALTAGPTVAWEFVHSHDDLIDWALRTGLIGLEQVQELEDYPQRFPRAANRICRQARNLRHNLRMLLSPDRDPTELHQVERAQRILAELRSSLQLLEITANGRGFRLGVGVLIDGAWLLAPVTLSALELLTSPDLARVKQCPGDQCGWLFLDTSRNASRRWCSMESCGNRAKARRHYEETRLPARRKTSAKPNPAKSEPAKLKPTESQP